MNIPSEQQEVARFLQGLAGTDPIETHISAVFVGSGTTWKLKKAVRLPFLDFSRIEARRHFLQRELALNHPAAPDIYRDVAAVVRDGDTALSLTTEPGERRPLDWVLRMAPIPPEDFLDAIASRGGLTPDLLDALGDCVADYHAGLPPVPEWDSPAALLQVAEGCVVSAQAAGLPAEAVQRWLHQVCRALDTCRPWLAARAAAGLVRRAHGDLHLGNLCLWHGKPIPFDALEFDEALATIDIGFDLAFLLMDLDQRVSRGAANRVLNRYVARTGDAALTGGLTPFLSLRAMVRAHVRMAGGHEADGRRYLQAALDYLPPKPPLVLAIGGLQGTGKSTLARLLAPGLGGAVGALVLRSDEIRKRQFAATPEQRLPPAAYTESANAAVGQALAELTRVVASGGQAVIADATFFDHSQRTMIAAAAKAAGAPFLGIWLHAPLAVLEARVAARRNDASDATVAVLRRAAARDPGPMNWLQVDACDADRAVAAIQNAAAATVAAPRVR
jgi:uncharacterized protein